MAVRNYEKKLAKEAKGNPKAFYKYVNSKTKSRVGILTLVSADGKSAECCIDKEVTLNKYFSIVFTKETTDNLPDFAPRVFDAALVDMSFDEDTIEKKLNGLKIGKSPGPDQIHTRLLKEMTPILKLLLQKFFKKCMSSSKIRDAWRLGHIMPIFKKGKKSDPANYRPVGLISVLCKVMESLVRQAVMAHLDRNSLLSEHQHGFMAGRTCSTQLLEVLDIGHVSSRKEVNVIYLDFAKAFNTVPHCFLMFKLHRYSVVSKIWDLIRYFLANRKRCVSVNGDISVYENVTSGIPQRNELGLLLFLVYINDLPDEVLRLIKLFADDTKLFARVRTLQDCIDLQSDLTAFRLWSNKWLLQFNTAKCKVLRLGSGSSPCTLCFLGTVLCVSWKSRNVKGTWES